MSKGQGQDSRKGKGKERVEGESSKKECGESEKYRGQFGISGFLAPLKNGEIAISSFLGDYLR